ncbi:MAG: glycosyltransferase [Patescibacteria group bacterium]|nr:glycosyltransferase [Patescibacteria group bacterium]
MKIGLDAGALCADSTGQFGTYRYTQELLWALETYGSPVHSYQAFAFCDLHYDSSIPVHSAKPSIGWTKLALPAALLIKGIDVYIAVNQELPGFFAGKKIAISHGLSFLFHRHMYYYDYHRLHAQLERYTNKSDYIIVSSERVRNEMIRYRPDTEARIRVLPFGIRAYGPAEAELTARPYFLFAGSDQPVKNLPFLLSAFKSFRNEHGYQDVELILAGPNLSSVPDGVRQVGHLNREKLQKLYSGALAYVTASVYESFNYPVLEALTAGCPVIGTSSAVIPEMQDAVTLADSKKAFTAALRDAYAGRLPKPDRVAIAERFSWRKYVRSLEELFV